jgi:hypothetical protein
MYVSSDAPLPQNSLNGMPIAQQNEMRRCIQAWNLAAATAKRNAYIYPDPTTGSRISANLQKDMQLGQRDAKLAAYAVLNNQAPVSPKSSGDAMVPAPEVMPLNAAASAEFGCGWDKSMLPAAMTEAKRVFLQSAPAGPQRMAPTPTPAALALTVANPATVQPNTAQPQPFSPCPPGVPFQNRYVGGAPVCGVPRFGAAPGAVGLPRAYASIVSGMGDSPNWADAYGSYVPEQSSVGGDLLSGLSSHPWIALLIAAGVIFGVSSIGKLR